MPVALILMLATVTMPDGQRLNAGDRCYTLSRGGQPVGVERQVIRPVRIGRERGWDIVVHQRVAAMRFDLRDHFVVRRRDLTPVSFDSRKQGMEQVRLTYAPGRVTGWRTGKAGREAIDQPLTGATWDGNLWGPVFSALPLSVGRSLILPFFHYDQGLGEFTLKVTGDETVDGVAAWALDAGTTPDRRSTYLLAKADGRVLGVRAGPFTTAPGGDCATLG